MDKLFSKKAYNLPNAITLSRIILAILTTVLLAVGASPLIVGALFCVSAIHFLLLPLWDIGF